MTVITRFAPSPTGFLHIGGARTALFNWLFARHHEGKFLLRIEDTDRERSTNEAITKIIEGITWLGLNWDEDPVYQFSNATRHTEIAHQLLDQGNAYKCFCTPDELHQMREEAKKKGEPMRYNGHWRDKTPEEAPEGAPFTIRLKAPLEGDTIIHDEVQGEVKVNNKQLDDMILLRSDGTPTYMLSVVVDDHDMGITHVIRGDDHLTNAFRQLHLYNALGWEPPKFAHIPLIHGADGAKLSKRHGALGVEAYRDMGILPEALRNYLLRLGWAHGDDEIINTEKAIEWFSLQNVGKSPARFDITKLMNLNGHYIREAEDARLVHLAMPLIEQQINNQLEKKYIDRLEKGMEGLKQRAKSIIELADNALIYISFPEKVDEKGKKFLDESNLALIEEIKNLLSKESKWEHDALEDCIRNFSEAKDIKLGKIAQPLRVALTGSTVSPSVFEVMDVLGRDESLKRLEGIKAFA